MWEWLKLVIVICAFIALVIDIFSTVSEKESLKGSSFLKYTNLVVSTALIFVFIYFIDLYDGSFIWIAFVLGFAYLIAVDIVFSRGILIKTGHFLGFGLISVIIFIMCCYTRYELQTQFYKPCWSPEGKQIAFFMEKALYRYHLGFPFSLWSPDDIWKKYYLCTMDYDGKNFKQIKETYQATKEISWSGSENIIYTQDFMQDIDTVLQRKILYTSPDGKESGTLYETAKIPTNDSIKGNERILDPWLSQNKRYLGFVLNYRESRPKEDEAKYGYFYDNYRLLVKDLKTQNIKLDILQADVRFGEYEKFIGAYNEDKIAYYDKEIIKLINLDNNMSKSINISKYKHNTNLPIFNTWGSSGQVLLGLWDELDTFNDVIKRLNGFKKHTPEAIAPTGDIGASSGSGNIIIGDRNGIQSRLIIKPKRSYLFNIFSE